MKDINIFMNTYEQPENKLTYNFLWLVKYLNNANFINFLSGIKNVSKSEPVENIETVFGGGEGNPDGAIIVKLDNGDIITIYIESKTYRREVDINQLHRHIKSYLKNNDLLLVITPREKDRNIVKNVNNKSIIFCTWQDIVKYIEENYIDDIIINEFIEYGNITGEFTVMKDIETSDLNIIIDWYKNNINDRLLRIFNSLAENIVEIFNEFNITIHSTKIVDSYGRQGVEISFKKPKIGLWAFFGLYYNESDHKIPFVNKGIPDICLLIDLNPKESRDKIDGNKEIINDFRNLEKYGFKCNDNGKLTRNRWRLISYQKSLRDYNSLSRDILENELKHILKLFKENSNCIINYMSLS